VLQRKISQGKDGTGRFFYIGWFQMFSLRRTHVSRELGRVRRKSVKICRGREFQREQEERPKRNACIFVVSRDPLN
jgi:hypothetical protein